jgi:hypothetical protein
MAGATETERLPRSRGEDVVKASVGINELRAILLLFGGVQISRWFPDHEIQISD